MHYLSISYIWNYWLDLAPWVHSALIIDSKIMSQGEHVYEESITLDHYVNISKRDTLAIKKLKKEEERPRRKESTQMSIFSWLQKGPSQNCAMYDINDIDWSLTKVWSSRSLAIWGCPIWFLHPGCAPTSYHAIVPCGAIRSSSGSWRLTSSLLRSWEKLFSWLGWTTSGSWGTFIRVRASGSAARSNI